MNNVIMLLHPWTTPIIIIQISNYCFLSSRAVVLNLFTTEDHLYPSESLADHITSFSSIIQIELINLNNNTFNNRYTGFGFTK